MKLYCPNQVVENNHRDKDIYLCKYDIYLLYFTSKILWNCRIMVMSSLDRWINHNYSKTAGYNCSTMADVIYNLLSTNGVLEQSSSGTRYMSTETRIIVLQMQNVISKFM